MNPICFPSLLRLTRLVSWVSRFLENCRIAKNRRSYRELTVEDVKDAQTHLIREAQQDALANECCQLLKGKQVKTDSKLISLQTFIDEHGLLLCNGRLRFVEILPYDARYPVLLPRKNWLTKFIVKFYYEKIILQVEQIKNWQLYQVVFG